MQQLMTVWLALDLGRRIAVVGATVIMFAAILGLSRMASQPAYSLLYAGLEPGAAGEVVAALDQRGIAYEVRNGSIFVDGAERDSLRLTLASEGLPANGAQGYELLDALSGFGTTSQMFDAAYWRAKEGELARTIAASPLIRQARVHISNPSSNPFQRDLKPSASVAIASQSGSISPGQAKALKFLVASAVAGLSPDDVSVIDSNGSLVASEEDYELTGGDRASELKRNIQRLIEARVGAGNTVVEVNVDTVMDSEAIIERRFDPEGRVAISTDTEERSSTATGTENDAVTVASNLPDGDAAGGASSSQSENNETRERVNYEVSETTREVVRAPGAIRRISVAVLVDGIRTVDASGATNWVERPDEELEDLRELVASAMGFDESRGDSITIKSLEFEPIIVDGTSEGPGLFSSLHFNAMTIIQIVVLSLVALALGMFVIRPILTSNPSTLPALGGPILTNAAAGAAGTSDGDESTQANLPINEPVLTGEIDDGLEPLAELPALGDSGGLDDLMPTPGFQYEEDPVDRLRQLIQDRREETVEILRDWMNDEHEENA